LCPYLLLKTFDKVKILADRSFSVASDLELTESESKPIWPIYDNYGKNLQEIAGRGSSIVDDVVPTTRTRPTPEQKIF